MGNYPYQPGIGMGPNSMQMQMQAPPGGPPAIQNFIPDVIPGVPPGLEVLHLTEHLFIRQTIDPAEFLFNAANKYAVLDTFGRRILFAVETTSYLARNQNTWACDNPFKISVLNFRGKEVLNMVGVPGSGWCQHGEVSVFQDGMRFGGAVEVAAPGLKDCCSFEPHIDVTDTSGTQVFTIISPPASFGTAEFNLYPGQYVAKTGGRSSVGRISKVWSGLEQEMFTTADNYGISFPKGLNVEMKAVLLGVAILIDFKYFEAQSDKNNIRGGHDDFGHANDGYGEQLRPRRGHGFGR